MYLGVGFTALSKIILSFISTLQISKGCLENTLLFFYLFVFIVFRICGLQKRLFLSFEEYRDLLSIWWMSYVDSAIHCCLWLDFMCFKMLAYAHFFEAGSCFWFYFLMIKFTFSFDSHLVWCLEASLMVLWGPCGVRGSCLHAKQVLQFCSVS